MKRFTAERLELLVTGYIKTVFNRYAPDIIIYKISVFYSNKNTIPFNVYTFEKRTYKCIKINENINNIIDMYTIGSSQYYITNNNQLYIFGRNVRGRLGIGNIDIDCNVNFQKHKYFDGKYIDVISQSRNSFHCILCVNDQLYECGSNNTNSNQISANIIEDKIVTPQFMCNIYDVFKSPIKQMESGRYHTLFLTENGNVYGSGKNHMNQLLLINKDISYEITLIPKLKHIKYICCGDLSSYSLDCHGIMCAFGQNNYGCLGAELGGSQYGAQSGFNEISLNDTKIRSINCGILHASYVTDNNNGYMFGENVSCQCGIKSKRKIVEPQKLVLNTNILNIKCGLRHNIIKTVNGNYYSFGSNYAGQCLISNEFKIYKPQLLSLKYLKNKIGNNNDIIALIPTYTQTFILQKI